VHFVSRRRRKRFVDVLGVSAFAALTGAGFVWVLYELMLH
jgi:hypothetical protein